VEGELDKLSLEEAGFTSVISVPSGALPPRRAPSATAASSGAPAPAAPLEPDARLDTKLAFLRRAWPVLKDTERILLATDGDAPGAALAEELARRLGRGRCWLLRWPAGCKDANDMLMGRDLQAAGLPGGGQPDAGRLHDYVETQAVPMPEESLV
jgi:twinkle protein